MKTQHKILAVDDDPINLEILEEILEDYDLLTASSGEEALEVAEVHQPDLILLDIMMPGMNGYEVCKKLRGNQDLKHAKIVLVSAKAMTSERLAGYEAGADDYLTKPFDSDELLAKVTVFLRLLSAEEMDQLKSELLNLLSHELRTPLSGIIPAGEVLSAAGEMGEDERMMWGEMVLENGKRILALAEKGDLLCMLRSNSYAFSGEVTDFADFVSNVVAEVQSESPDRNFSIKIPAGEFMVAIDQNLIRWALRGMLENGLRFGPDDQAIEVNVQCDGTNIGFSVTDHGPGIEEDVLGTVFQAFTQRIVESKPVGAGLSMALARAIMRVHGGDVSVESIPGTKTTFEGWLPVCAPAEVEGTI